MGRQRISKRLRSIGSLAGLLAALHLGAAPASAQEGAPLFPDATTLGADASETFIADFDGDGTPDVGVRTLAFSPVIQSTFTVLFAEGNGTLTASPSVLIGSGNVAVGVGELSGDGKLDLAIVSQGLGSNVKLLLGQGDGSFTSGPSFAVNHQPRTVTVADFNADGKPDLASVAFGSVHILLGDGAGGFTSVGTFVTGSESRTAEVGDFNGDGKLDLAAPDYGGFKDETQSVTVLLGNGNGGFTALPAVPMTPWFVSMAVGDFDEDGTDDFVVTDHDVDTATLYLGQGDGSFVSSLVLPLFGAPWDTMVADVDDDGHDDIVAGRAGSFRVFRGNGAAGFTNAGTFDFGPLEFGVVTGFESGPLAASDFNTDGKLDVAATTPQGVTLVLGRGDGTFTGKLTTEFGPGSNASWVAAGDFDGDAHVDLVATLNSFPYTMNVLLGQGDGTFESLTPFAAATYPWRVVTGLLNADGHQDLAVASEDGVTIYLGLGNGGFTNHGTIPFSDTVRDVVAGRFNGDATDDLAVIEDRPLSPDTATILLAQGDGSFTSSTTITVAIEAADLVVGDFNGDTLQDFAAADASTELISIRLGQGNGTFVNGGFVPLGIEPVAVATADLDGDGKLDLVTANFEPSSVSVALGLGNGTFASSTSFAVGGALTELATGDFDADGNVDVAVTDVGPFHNGGAVLLLLGDGDGGLALHGTFAVGDYPGVPAVADLDEDGHPDVATADLGAGTISVLLNQTDEVSSVWTSLGSGLAGSGGVPSLTGTGLQLSGSPVSLDLKKAKASALAVLFIGPAGPGAPFKGGILVPSLLLSVPFVTSATGTISIPFAWPSGLPSGFSMAYQYGIQDAAAVHGVALSTALQSTTP